MYAFLVCNSGSKLGSLLSVLRPPANGDSWAPAGRRASTREWRQTLVGQGFPHSARIENDQRCRLGARDSPVNAIDRLGDGLAGHKWRLVPSFFSMVRSPDRIYPAFGMGCECHFSAVWAGILILRTVICGWPLGYALYGVPSHADVV